MQVLEQNTVKTFHSLFILFLTIQINIYLFAVCIDSFYFEYFQNRATFSNFFAFGFMMWTLFLHFVQSGVKGKSAVILDRQDFRTWCSIHISIRSLPIFNSKEYNRQKVQGTYVSAVVSSVFCQRAIFQTVLKQHCCTKSMFFELETSNYGYLLTF